MKAERLHRLQALVARQQAAFQAGLVGRTLPVLVEKPGRNPGQVGGKSPYLTAVHFPGGADLVGRIVPVRIAAAAANSLAGELRASEACVAWGRQARAVFVLQVNPGRESRTNSATWTCRSIGTTGGDYPTWTSGSARPRKPRRLI